MNGRSVRTPDIRQTSLSVRRGPEATLRCLGLAAVGAAKRPAKSKNAPREQVFAKESGRVLGGGEPTKAAYALTFTEI